MIHSDKMKKITLLLTAAALAATLLSCNKEDSSAVSDGAGKEIVLMMDESFDASVDTKTTAITSAPSSLYWGASTGSAGSETVKWASASATVSSNKISTGKVQTSPATTYNYYVSNLQPTIAAAQTTITVPDNGTDYLAARVASNSATPSIALNHIFARTGTLTLNKPSGHDSYSLTVNWWKIVGKSTINGTAGTYNMTTDAWTAASTKLSSATTITSGSDLYLIPGDYTISVNYTYGVGDYTQTVTKSADVTLQKGKVNNITGTAVFVDASSIVLTVSVTAWGTNNITIDSLS